MSSLFTKMKQSAGFTRQFCARWKLVHLTPQVSVVFFGCLEQLQVTVRGIHSARFANSLHLGSTERLKATCGLKILTQHAKRIDAANAHRNRQAYGIAQSHRDNDGTLAYKLAATSRLDPDTMARKKYEISAGGRHLGRVEVPA